MILYPWLVLLHLIGVLGWLFAHGTSAFVSFRIRRETNLDRVTGLLQLVQSANAIMYPFFYLLLIAGILAGVNGHWFGHGWIWTGLALFIVVTIAMYAIATPYYTRLRGALGLPGRGRAPKPATRASDAEVLAMLDSRRPEILAGVGVVGLLLIVWLMVMKPF